VGWFPKKDGRFTGFGVSNVRPDDQLTPAERKLLERIAEQLLEEHGETLKKLGDE
jgi:hypothetical protein